MNAPSEQVRHELDQYLAADQTRVGQVYRLGRRGLSPDRIATELGVATSGFVSNNRTIARALLEGHVPSGPAAARQVLGFVHKASRSQALSKEARAYLSGRAEVLERVAGGAPRSQAPSPLLTEMPPQQTTQQVEESADHVTLRQLVEDQLRRRITECVERIREDLGVAATDYWAVVTSDDPLAVITRLVRTPGEQAGTFKQLADVGRLDLSLEAALEKWTRDLPLQRDLVEDARAKRQWFDR